MPEVAKVKANQSVARMPEVAKVGKSESARSDDITATFLMSAKNLKKLHTSGTPVRCCTGEMLFYYLYII